MAQPVKDPRKLIELDEDYERSWGPQDEDEDISLDEYTKRKGKKLLTQDEYREFIKPKIAKTYKQYKAEGRDDDFIRKELTDAYGYEDLINEAMGTPEYSKFQKGKFTQKDAWNKELDELSKTKPDKIDLINKMRGYDDEQIALYNAFKELLGGK